MYLIDTNICIAIIKNDTFAINHFKDKYAECYLSSLVLGELYKGVYCSSKIIYNLNVLNQFADKLPIVEFSSKDALELGIIQGELRKMGKPTGVMDGLLGAMARVRQDILVTDNTKHFINIPNLQLENWLK